MEKFNSVTVWMANPTAIEGIVRINGEEIPVPGWTLGEVQEFAYLCAQYGVQIQAFLAGDSGAYFGSYVTGDGDDGLLFFRGNTRR